MVDFLLWAVVWLTIFGFFGYLLFMVVVIVCRATRLVYLHVRFVSEEMAQNASMTIARGIVFGTGWIIRQVRESLAQSFAPLAEKMKQKQRDTLQEMRELAELSGTVKGARDILGLPEVFTKADLKNAYWGAAKRAAPDAGGTDGLMKMVNLSKAILEPYAR